MWVQELVALVQACGNRDKLLEMSFLDEQRWAQADDMQKEMDVSLAASLHTFLVECLAARIDYASQVELSMPWVAAGLLGDQADVTL